jgi:hypothetical protein
MAKQKAKTEPVSILVGKDVELVMTKGELAFLKILEYTEAVSVIKGNHPKMKKKSGWTYKIHQIGNSQFKNIKKL